MTSTSTTAYTGSTGSTSTTTSTSTTACTGSMSTTTSTISTISTTTTNRGHTEQEKGDLQWTTVVQPCLQGSAVQPCLALFSSAWLCAMALLGSGCGSLLQ